MKVEQLVILVLKDNQVTNFVIISDEHGGIFETHISFKQIFILAHKKKKFMIEAIKNNVGCKKYEINHKKTKAKFLNAIG